MHKTVEILGIPFSNRTLNETVNYLEGHIQQEKSKLLHLVTINPEITITAQSDVEFQNMKKLKIGVIGAGSLTDAHLEAYKSNPDVELIAVCDTFEERARKKLKNMGLLMSTLIIRKW